MLRRLPSLLIKSSEICKPGALRNGAPFTDLPEGFKRPQAVLLKQPGGDREMVEILELVLHHDEQAVPAAVELALEAGLPTKTHVLNVLHRLLDGKPPSPSTKSFCTSRVTLSITTTVETFMPRSHGTFPAGKGSRRG